MRDWISSLSVERLPEFAIALAAGYAVATLADNVGELTTTILAQHIGRDPSGEDPSILGLTDLFSSPYYLNVEIGGTVVVYGGVLSGLLGLALVTLVAAYVVRRRDRELGECPFCASRIPYESSHCAYCGSSVAPGEPS